MTRIVIVDVVVGDHHQLIQIPDGTPSSSRFLPADLARAVMHHRQVDLTGYDFARCHAGRHRRLCDNFFGESLVAIMF